MICSSSAYSMALTIDIRPSSAPNVFGSPSWNTHQSNALNSLENGLGNIGDRNTSPTAYEILNGEYMAGDVMVTSGNSWRGQANPAAPFDQEHGNRLHFGLHLFGDGVVQFKLEDLNFAITSSDAALNFAGNFSGLSFNGTSRIGIHWGADRAKGGGDDTVYVAGNGTTLIDEMVYVGVGNAYWPDFTPGPDLQADIDSTINYLKTNKPVIMGEYSIVGTDKITYRNKETLVFVPEPGTLALFGLGLAGIGIARRKRMI